MTSLSGRSVVVVVRHQCGRSVGCDVTRRQVGGGVTSLGGRSVAV